ncbi:MAG TPA: cyclic nucleotide-binding domain-containing protein [Bauldia sp.]|nr:cyclic nucleotide-binding domain-containing protein [Bauldia sp.]
MTTLAQILGYAAALLLIISFAMQTLIWLRYVAIAAAIVLGAYGIAAGQYVVLALAVVLLAVNLWRLWEVKRLGGAARAAAAGAGAPITVDWLLPHMDPVALPKGHVLFHKGDPADAMYFVSKGRIELKEFGIEIGKGSLFGEIGIFAVANVRTATAVCAEDCSLLRVSAERMRELFYQNPEFGFFLVGVITRRLMEDMERASGGKLAPT